MKDTLNDLESSRDIAMSRYLGLERRFKKDSELEEKYRNEMNELIAAGYLKKASGPPTGLSYYIPHHAVLEKFRIKEFL